MAILEVGLGGRLDATNCVPSPVVTGISSLGFDHMEILGYTLPVSQAAVPWALSGRQESRVSPSCWCAASCSCCCHRPSGCLLQEIAREKAGIFKPGVPALTVQQPADAHAALQVGAAVRLSWACVLLCLHAEKGSGCAAGSRRCGGGATHSRTRL